MGHDVSIYIHKKRRRTAWLLLLLAGLFSRNCHAPLNRKSLWILRLNQQYGRRRRSICDRLADRDVVVHLPRCFRAIRLRPIHPRSRSEIVLHQLGECVCLVFGLLLDCSFPLTLDALVFCGSLWLHNRGVNWGNDEEFFFFWSNFCECAAVTME